MSPNGESYYAPEWPSRNCDCSRGSDKGARVFISNELTQKIVDERNAYIEAMRLMRKDGIDVDAYMRAARGEVETFRNECRDLAMKFNGEDKPKEQQIVTHKLYRAIDSLDGNLSYFLFKEFANGTKFYSVMSATRFVDDLEASDYFKDLGAVWTDNHKESRFGDMQEPILIAEW